MTASQKPRRTFYADLAAEQRRISGGAKANKRAKLLEDFPGIGQVFETGAGRVFEPSERLSEIRLRIENKLSGDDVRRFNKRRHVHILDWLKRVAIHAELRRAGGANDKSYAAIGAEAVKLLGVSLNPASRDSVLDLRADLMLALERFDRISNRQPSLSKEGVMKLAALDLSVDYITRALKLPTENEVQDCLKARGYEFSGEPKSIKRQWNRLFQWWREVFLVARERQT